MRSKIHKKRNATAPVVNKPGSEMSNDEETFALLFCTEEESDAAIQAIMEDDPEGEKGIPYEQVKAEQDRQLEVWAAAAKRRQCSVLEQPTHLFDFDGEIVLALSVGQSQDAETQLGLADSA